MRSQSISKYSIPFKLSQIINCAFILSGMLFFPHKGYCQSYHRVEADFSIKEVWGDSVAQLTMGTVYYDKHIHSIVYKVSFPEAQTWILEDSFLHIQSTDTLISRQNSPASVDMSIFNLVLNDELSNYGLTDSMYIKSSVSRQNGLIIATWKPHPKLAHLMGDILISRKGKLLHAVIFKTATGKILSKQFFKEYDLSEGLPFPTNLTQVLYKDDMEIYRVTTFRNVRYNSPNGEGHYTDTFRK